MQIYQIRSQTNISLRNKKVTYAGIEITDEFMGEFHRQGLAKEFKMYG